MQKFYTLEPRYVDGKYIHADAEHPALVEFPDGVKITASHTLYPVEKAAEIEPPKPHFAPGKAGAAPMAHSRDKAGGKRPSDSDPV
jgi:hypothetical protein